MPLPACNERGTSPTQEFTSITSMVEAIRAGVIELYQTQKVVGRVIPADDPHLRVIGYRLYTEETNERVWHFYAPYSSIHDPGVNPLLIEAFKTSSGRQILAKALSDVTACMGVSEVPIASVWDRLSKEDY